MLLLIIRHAIAEDKEEFAKTGKSDDVRPITPEGRDKMLGAAKGLKIVVPDLSLLATSPFTRAVQTGEIVASTYGRAIDETIDALKADAAFDELIEWLEPRASKKVVAVVGHEPHLTGLTSWLISGKDSAGIELKKGGACMIQFGQTPARGKGTLLWSIPPAQLRALAK